MQIIDAKRRNKEPELERQERSADSNVVDLMERLRRSLGQARGRRVVDKAADRPPRSSASRAGARKSGTRRPRRAGAKEKTGRKRAA